MLGRALLSAGARGDKAQWKAIAEQFRTRTAAVRTLARIVAASFQIAENDLSMPMEEAEITALLDEAAEKQQEVSRTSHAGDSVMGTSR